MTEAASAPPRAVAFNQEGGDGKWSPKLKLHGLRPNDLPPHQDLASHQTSPPDLSSFLQNLFREVQQHFDIKESSNGTSKDSVTAGGNTFPIVVHKTKSKDNEGLLWFGRTSKHDEAKPVTFEELRNVLMRDHERNEAEYTPGIYDVNTLLDWYGDLKGRDFNCGDKTIADVEMRITQMHHKMPGVGLNDRVFTVLLLAITVKTSPSPEAIDMQLPIDLAAFPTTVLSRSHSHAHAASSGNPDQKLIYQNRNENAASGQKDRNGKDVVEGRYVSWERLRKLDEETTEWVMRTASDAGGALPAWMQKLGVPGAIVKDVPLALKFAVERQGHGTT